MLVDLHTHTTSSDGIYTPRCLLEAANLNNIELLAITDHDTVNGYLEALDIQETMTRSPRLISGVEMGTQVGEASVHILGYHIDANNKALIDKLYELRNARETRLEKIIKKIRDLGYAIEIPQKDSSTRAVGRPHVAKALVEKGYFKDVQEAFDKLLKRGKPGYEPQPKLSPEEAVKLIHNAGGIAVLAHPSELENINLVRYLLQKIAFDGLEVYHPSADEFAQKTWLQISKEFNLMVSGGSDFHGVSGRFPEKLGLYKVLYENTKNVIEYKK